MKFRFHPSPITIFLASLFALTWLFLFETAWSTVDLVGSETDLPIFVRDLRIFLIATLPVFLWLVVRMLGWGWPAWFNRFLRLVYWPYAILVGLGAAFMLAFSSYGTVSGYVSLRLYYLLTVLALVALATPSTNGQYDYRWLLGGWVVTMAFFAVGAALQEIISYPFNLFWSEGNRFWDYSVLYGRHLYDFPEGQAIPAYIDRGRQSLWGLLWLFFDPTIKQMRLWNLVVFSVPYFLFGWFVFQKPRGNTGLSLILSLWVFIFLYHAPIYTPLVLAAILVVGGRRLPLPVNLLLVGLAGYYVQASRYTWIFAPAMWAGLLAFVPSLAKDSFSHQPGLRDEWRNWLLGGQVQRWWRAAILALAGVTGSILIPEFRSWLAAMQTTTAGAPLSGVGETLGRQPLLWSRLLPNASYPLGLGVLLDLALTAGPLIVWLLVWLFSRRWKLDFWQKLAVSASLLAFFVVGLIVSVKIGGGSNLHNMDMFLISLVLLAGVAVERGLLDRILQSRLAAATLALIIIFPVVQLFIETRPLGLPSASLINEGLDSTRQLVEKAAKIGPVLFIDNRQLLTFGYVEDVPLIADYEKKHMMDEAMSRNQAYFEPFYADLQQHRFCLIVSEVLRGAKNKSDDVEFSREEDLWVEWVSEPVLAHYWPADTYDSLRLQLLLPRDGPCKNLK